MTDITDKPKPCAWHTYDGKAGIQICEIDVVSSNNYTLSNIETYKSNLSIELGDRISSDLRKFLLSL